MPEPTYDTFALHQLCPVTGWFGVWWDRDTQQHFTQPVVCLALVTRTARNGESDEPLHRSRLDMPDTERREITGLWYSLKEGFNLCAEDDNFCGLLAPSDTLADCEAARACNHYGEED